MVDAALAFEDRLSIDFDDEEAFCAPRRLPLSRAKRSARLRRRFALGALAALAIGCVMALRQSSEPSSFAGAGELPAPPPAWAPIAKSQPLFAIAAPDFSLQPRTYAARRHRTGGGQQDILDFGDVAGPGPYLRLIIYRVGTEATLEAPFLSNSRAAPPKPDARSLSPLSPQPCRRGSERSRPPISI